MTPPFFNIICTHFLLCVGLILNAQEITFENQAVETDFLGIACIKMIDLDNDGDLDLIGGSEITPISESNGIAWWRNEGNNIWTRFFIDSLFVHVMSVDAAYIDSDDKIDIVASSWELNEVAWWKNSGNPEYGWTKKSIRTNYTNAHDAQCADIDLDGDIDIITANSTPGSIDIYYNQNDQPVTWNNVQLTSNFAGAKSVRISDLDADNDLDIICTADGANEIAWWENVGSNSQFWQKRLIDQDFGGSCFADIVDLNNDSNLDVVANGWSSDQLACWTCDNYYTNSWNKTVISTNLEIPVRSFGCDVDLDGDMDVAAIGKVPGQLILFRNDEENWTEQVLLDEFSGAGALSVVDIDDDGDTDIIAGAGMLGKIVLLENKTLSTSVGQNFMPSNRIKLYPNYPNPIKNHATISWFLPEKCEVELAIMNSNGLKMTTLIDETQLPGKHQKTFNFSSYQPGIYFYMLKVNAELMIHKTVVTN